MSGLIQRHHFRSPVVLVATLALPLQASPAGAVEPDRAGPGNASPDAGTQRAETETAAPGKNSEKADFSIILHGVNRATSGDAVGVRGESASPSGTGVVGRASATAGDPSGVVGISDAADGAGVTGLAGSGGGASRGVYGATVAADGAGVVAENFFDGTDLLLVGPTDLMISDEGFTVNSAGDETLDFTNAGAGSLSLSIDGNEVTTELTDDDELGGMSCSDRETIHFDGVSGQWLCSPSPITSVTAGTGLSGGGSSGDVALSVAADGIDSDKIADGTVQAEDLALNASRIYGDGSGGSTVLSGPGSFTEPFPMYTDITIESGGTLFVESGTVIRCMGNFTNDGVIDVGRSAARGSGHTGEPASSLRPPHPGLSRGIPEIAVSEGDSVDNISGSAGGLPTDWSHIVAPGIFAGGAGSGQVAGAGGGSILIVCAGTITNSGQIRAEGESHPFVGAPGVGGGGGGGGGFVLLAAGTSIANSGLISAKGGDGGPSDSGHGAGGGGGGGQVHLIAPSINDTGTLDVAGGTAGEATQTPVDDFVLTGGGGGGGAVGGGGAGGDVSANTAQPAGNGGAGESLQTTADPEVIFAIQP